MRIDGLNGANILVGGMNMMQSKDSVSKNLQSQIANAQKQLQQLLTNKDMSMEEKIKKQQEIQQQIADLNNQLRQHQMEQRKEQQAKKSSMYDMACGSKKTTPKAGKRGTGLSQQCMDASMMRAMIAADSAIVQAQVQGSVAARMEGRAGVLESEIKLDQARGADVEKKKAELADVQQKAAAAESAQMNTLAAANKELEEAAKTEQQSEQADDEEKKTDRKEAVVGEKEDQTVAGTDESKNKEVLDKAVTAESGVLAETGVWPTEEVKYKKINILI